MINLLCNHKHAVTEWATGMTPVCCCQTWAPFKKACLNPGAKHWILSLSGTLLADLLPPEQAVVAEGSLSNKVFPSKKEYTVMMIRALNQWTRTNGLPSITKQDISGLMTHHTPIWSQHCKPLTNHLTKSTITALHTSFDGAVFHCEDKQASSLQIFCPCLYYQSLDTTFLDDKVFECFESLGS